MVPLLVLVLGLGRHEAQGTSLATMLPPVGLPGLLVYARTGDGLPWVLVGALAAGFAGGALVGARLAGRTGAARLERAFSVFVAAVAVALLWRVFR